MMDGTDDVMLGWDTCQVVNDLKKKGQTGIVMMGFKLLPSKLVGHIWYKHYELLCVWCNAIFLWGK